MPTTTVVPNLTLLTRATIVGGLGSIHASLADALDTTYIQRGSGVANTNYAEVRFGAPTIPANNDPVALSLLFRAKDDGTKGPTYVGIKADVPGGTLPYNALSTKRTSVWTDNVFAFAPTVCSLADLATATTYLLHARVYDGTVYTARTMCSRIIATYYYLPRLLAAPQTAASYTSSKPTLSTLIDSATVNDVAEHEVEIEWAAFTAAQYDIGGFDPATSPATWRKLSYVTAPYNAALNVTAELKADVAFPATGTMRLYTRARRYVESGQFREWTSGEFTMAVIPTDPPTTSVTIDGQRVAVSVTPLAKTGHTLPLIDVERSADGGTTWVQVRGADNAAGTFGSASFIYDYEAPRGVALKYRARIETTLSGEQVTSAWSTVDAAGPVLAVGWNIKVPLAPAKNAYGVAVLRDPSYTTTEDVATFRPKGRKFPVVVSAAIGGADGSMDVLAIGASEIAAIDAVAIYQGVLLLESPFGWARYIRIQSRSWDETGTPGAPRRRYKLDYLEVAAP